MKGIRASLVSGLLLFAMTLSAQGIKLDKDNLLPNQVFMSFEHMKGKGAVRAIKDSTMLNGQKVDEPTFVRVKGIDFANGTIEIKVLSRLLKNAPETARGFIGVAFRINEDNSRYECIYIRPTNARADDQIRRNHTIQYYSYPDYKFDRLRKEFPEQYESYSDMALGEWITMKIVVKGEVAKLYIDDAKQPCLVVKEMKHGAMGAGSIGLYVGMGTEGYFADLKVIAE